MKVDISAADKQAFERHGYILLRKVISSLRLEALREECRRFMEQEDAAMAAQGVDHFDLTFRGKRYFFSQKLKQSGVIREVAMGETMASITLALLGPDVYFFLDQFVVKGPETGMHFSWHQDSGYIPYEHRPYITCWLPLDDVDEANGTVYLLTYDEAGTRARTEHRKDSALNDQVGYFGDRPGTPAILKAGDMAVFSSTVFHRSGANSTPGLRRAFLMQYSAEPIYNLDGQPRHWVEPLLKGGRVLAAENRPAPV